MFASNVRGYNALRSLFEGGHDLGNVITVDFNLSDSFGACARAPSAAQPIQAFSFGR